MQDLVRIVYISEATVPWATEALHALASASSIRNREIDVSGLLLYSCGTFMQCIEGPEHAINKLYSRIEKDPRHTRVQRVTTGPVPKRLFGHWWMGLIHVDHDAGPLQRSQLVGIIRDARNGSHTDVVKLLKSFRELLPQPARA